jgi:hypothetical protein
VVSVGCELDVCELLLPDRCVPEDWVMPKTVVAFEDPLLKVAVREPTS